MATLTWQDVTGRVAAPDFRDASAMITQGINNLGGAVRDLGTAPDQRRKAELANQALLLNAEAGIVQDSAKQMDALGNRIKLDKKEKDVTEFTKNQSYLESASRQAAINGIPLPDALATDKVYQSMGDGAKAYSAGHLFDAYMRGDETRIRTEERKQDQAYRAQQDLIQNQHWNATFAEQKRNNAAMRQERAEAKAAAAALKPRVWKTGNDKTDKAMSLLAQNTGMQFIEASGAAYQDKTISELGKNYKNLGAVADVFGKVNAERRAQHLPMLPENVLKRIIDTGVGSNSTFDGLNDVDDAAITDALLSAGKQFDTALKGREYYEQLSARVDAGSRPKQEHIDLGWNMMFPKAPKSETAKPAPKNTDAPFILGRM